MSILRNIFSFLGDSISLKKHSKYPKARDEEQYRALPDHYTEIWSKEDRAAYVERWKVAVNAIGNRQKNYYPNGLMHREYDEWFAVWSVHWDMPPADIERGSQILLNYPSDRKGSIEAIGEQLRREYAGRVSVKYRQRRTSFTEEEKYILCLEDEGEILDGVPWAVLRYRIWGSTLAFKHYLEFKQKVINANLQSRDELVRFLNDLIESYHTRGLQFPSVHPDLRSEEDKLWHGERYGPDELFDLTYPELVRIDQYGERYRLRHYIGGFDPRYTLIEPEEEELFGQYSNG